MRNIFAEKSCTKFGGETIPIPLAVTLYKAFLKSKNFFKKQKAGLGVVSLPYFLNDF